MRRQSNRRGAPMIKRIVIENFKSFKKVDLELGRLNLFIGTNASGKSNLFDALRVLRGVAGGFPVKDLFEGGARTIGGETWPGIRGGLANAIHKPLGVSRVPVPSEARMEIHLGTSSGETRHEFAFSSNGATTREKLTKDGKEIFVFEGHEAYFRVSEREVAAAYPNSFLGSQVVLAFRTGLAGAHKGSVEAWLRHLLNMQFLELEPEVLRHYGAAADIPRMGEHGENFASLVRHICGDTKQKGAYLSWLQELRPQEVEDVITLTGAIGEPLFALREGGRDFPAPVLSDGTLRFAALAASFFQPDMPEVLTIEEIENGIHASRLRLLVELLRNQSITAETQVMATTHSGLVLAWLKPDEYATTFLCKRDEETGESHILPLAQVPRFKEIVARQPISDLFAEGWMEAVL
jgi:predicted ATPase